MDNDIQKTIRLSMQQTTGDTATPRSDACRASTAASANLLNMLGDDPKMGHAQDQANISPTLRPVDSECPDAITERHGNPKSTAAVTVSTLSMPVQRKIPSRSASAGCASTGKIAGKLSSNTTVCNVHVAKSTAAKSKKRCRDDETETTNTSGKKTKKRKLKHKKHKKKKKKSYKRFLANALRPKHTRAEKIKMHLITIKKSLGGGQIPKIDRL